MKINKNEKLNRYEIETDGEFAYIEYQFYKDDIALMHTFVPESARGKGVASKQESDDLLSLSCKVC